MRYLVKLVSADGLSRYDGYYDYPSPAPTITTVIMPRLTLSVVEDDMPRPLQYRVYEPYDRYFDSERGVYVVEYREVVKCIVP